MRIPLALFISTLSIGGALAQECTGRCALVVDLATAIVWVESCPNLALSERAAETLGTLKAAKGEMERAGYAASRQRDKTIAEHADACRAICSEVRRHPACRFLIQSAIKR